MDYPELEMQSATSRTFWHHHSQDQANDYALDINIVSTMPPLDQACSSFLFPSLVRGSGTSHCQDFKSPYTNEIMLEEIPESRGCANTITLENMDSLQLSWLSAPPHRDHARVSAPGHLQKRPYLHHEEHSNGESSLPAAAAPDSWLHDLTNLQPANYQAFLQPFTRRQASSLSGPAADSCLQLVTKFNAKTSWQCDAGGATDYANMSAGSEKKVSYKDPLDSPCSVISGYTDVLQGANPLSGGDYVESFGTPSTSTAAHHQNEGKPAGASRETTTLHASTPGGMSTYSTTSGTHDHQGAGGQSLGVRPKRKRTRTFKHGDEVESQRMTHIAVERNRRKQMNEHLAALRALMPGSYVQKGDQASIVGGAIEFVKELEQLLQCLQAQKRRRAYGDQLTNAAVAGPGTRPAPGPVVLAPPPFSFHTGAVSQGSADPASSFLQGSATESLARLRHLQNSPSYNSDHISATAVPATEPLAMASGMKGPAETGMYEGMYEGVGGEMVAAAKSEMASVEVKLVGSDRALVKIMSQRRSGQLLRTVVALESLYLTILHTNITTIQHTVLYTFNVAIGAKCRMTVEEMAAALHQTFSSIHSLQF